MRRLLITLLVLCLCVAMPARAQTQTPTPAAPAAAPDPADDAPARAEAAAVRAERAIDTGLDTLNMVMTFVTVLIAFLGVLGLASFSSISGIRNRMKRELSRIRKLRHKWENASLALYWLNLGQNQYRARDYDGAIKLYQRARELDPDNPFILYRLGYVSTHRGDLDSAEQWLEAALKLDERFPHALVALGYVYRRQAELASTPQEGERLLKLAQRRMREGLEQIPHLIDEEGESWWGALGRAYRELGDQQRAIAAYERAREVTPTSSYPYTNLALLYLRANKDWNAARRQFRESGHRAKREVETSDRNHWAYADWITSRLILNEEPLNDVLKAMQDHWFPAVPRDTSYPLAAARETMQQIVPLLAELSPTDDLRAVIERLNAAALDIERYVQQSYERDPVTPPRIGG